MPNMFNGVPGVNTNDTLPEDIAGAVLMQPKEQKLIGEKEINKAIEILTKYKSGKSNLETRIVDDELWWELRHWESIGKRSKGSNNKMLPENAETTSAWLFNALLNKHADAMDNYPEPIVLPREREDEPCAKMLCSILPVVQEYNDFEHTYSLNWWEKLKHGTAAYGVFWNSEKENGLGDIDIREIDLLKLFWEPGVTDIQKSRNLFIVDLVDTDLLDQMYPEHKGKLKGNTIDIKQYIYDDDVDTTNKSVVVDWYYKVKSPSGKTILHYAKFVGQTLLFASENEPEYREKGWYDHGKYPVILDVMFPEKGTPIGFGYVSICKDPQIYIDKLQSNILQNSLIGTKKRYFMSKSTGVNKDQFRDLNEEIIDVEGDLDDTRIREITPNPLAPIYANVWQLKIEEMKDTAANRDVNSGGAGGGITAASAIAALQEAGNKASRDMISTSYRAFTEVCEQCIELMGQFYDTMRSFRITGEMPGQYEFIDVNNDGIKDQLIGVDAMGQELYRKPVYDLKIKAQKKSPFSRMEQNERAKELYAMGFFNPERAQESLAALEMMDFEGIDKVKEYVSNGQTLMAMVQELTAMVQQLSGIPMGGEPTAPQSGNIKAPIGNKSNSSGINDTIMDSQAPKTSYAQSLAKRSKPDMNTTPEGATPK